MSDKKGVVVLYYNGDPRFKIIVSATRYDRSNDPDLSAREPQDADALDGHDEYFYNEHTCPTNFIKDTVGVVFADDSDPHGLFRFDGFIEGDSENKEFIEGIEAELIKEFKESPDRLAPEVQLKQAVEYVAQTLKKLEVAQKTNEVLRATVLSVETERDAALARVKELEAR